MGNTTGRGEDTAVNIGRTGMLTTDEVERFRRDGFVAIDRPVVAPADLRAAEERITRLLYTSLAEGVYHDLGDGSAGSPQIHELPHISRRDPALLSGGAYAALVRVARDLLGCDRVRHHFDHVILKPPRNGAETGWHQDIAFDPTHDDPMATLWLSFSDVDETSGCMRYLPGSQHLEPLEHVAAGRNGRRAVTIDTTGAVSCPLPAGGVAIHGARTLHGSPPNDSDRPRLAWIVKFVPEYRPEWRVRARRGAERVGLRKPAE